MLVPSASVHVFTAFSLLSLAGLALVVWRLQSKLAELRAVVDAGRARDQHRRLAMLGMVDWTLALQHSGCVRVDLSSGDLQVELSTMACNGHACPPCFGLRTTRGVKVHTATFSKCAEMLVSDTRQLGFGTFQQALQPLEFINLSPDNAVAISDGARDFLVPAGAHVRGACVAGSGSEIHLNSSLRKHMRPGSTWNYLSDGSSSWNGRVGSVAVVRTDGVVLVMGGKSNSGTFLNDVYGSAGGGSTWARLTVSAAWSPRTALAAVVRLDGVVLVLGGTVGDSVWSNEVYGSADGGATWAQLTSSAAWSPRAAHAATVCADGAVLVLGGQIDGGYANDVYGSEDGGATWSQRTASAAWSERKEHAAVVRADGVVLVLGGNTLSGRVNDVYSSEDGGVTWQQLTASAAWSPRKALVSVVRADGAVLVLGGSADSGRTNDVYGSDDGGTTWTVLTAAAAWNPRNGHAAVVRADGAVLVVAGSESAGRTNDVYVSEA